jgi:alkyl hydroperoxide reductase subunit D
MSADLEALRERLPDAARDLKLNLSAVLGDNTLPADARWGVASAAAFASRDTGLMQAIVAAAREAGVSDATVDDARAAAALMAMNNVYYRFRHMAKKPAYEQMPPRLRMQRLAQPQTSKADFELACLAVSAVNGCEMCVQAHERVVLEAGVTEAQVHDAIRIAATVNAAATASMLRSRVPA